MEVRHIRKQCEHLKHLYNYCSGEVGSSNETVRERKNIGGEASSTYVKKDPKYKLFRGQMLPIDHFLHVKLSKLFVYLQEESGHN
jgi:hypothetical protein